MVNKKGDFNWAYESDFSWERRSVHTEATTLSLTIS